MQRMLLLTHQEQQLQLQLFIRCLENLSFDCALRLWCGNHIRAQGCALTSASSITTPDSTVEECLSGVLMELCPLPLRCIEPLRLLPSGIDARGLLYIRASFCTADIWDFSLRIEPTFESGRMLDMFETGRLAGGLASGLPTTSRSSSDMVPQPKYLGRSGE